MVVRHIHLTTRILNTFLYTLSLYIWDKFEPLQLIFNNSKYQERKPHAKQKHKYVGIMHHMQSPDSTTTCSITKVRSVHDRRCWYPFSVLCTGILSVVDSMIVGGFESLLVVTEILLVVMVIVVVNKVHTDSITASTLLLLHITIPT